MTPQHLQDRQVPRGAGISSFPLQPLICPPEAAEPVPKRAQQTLDYCPKCPLGAPTKRINLSTRNTGNDPTLIYSKGALSFCPCRTQGSGMLLEAVPAQWGACSCFIHRNPGCRAAPELVLPWQQPREGLCSEERAGQHRQQGQCPSRTDNIWIRQNWSHWSRSSSRARFLLLHTRTVQVGLSYFP